MESSENLEGRRIGQFRLGKRLGKGGMGHVYLAHDEKLDRRVALKVLHGRQHLQSESHARLRREARLLSQLDHPNICRIFDLVEEGGHAFLVLEYIEGTNLREARRRGDLNDRHAMDIARQIAAALVVAHQHGVVHRDLKPENVLLTPEGDVKVLDFGIALSVKHNLETGPLPPTITEYSDDDSEITEAATVFATTEGGVITGTLAYMSPEQARGEFVTAASDMYSFGLMLQEFFTGERAYPKCSAANLLTRASQANTTPVRGLDPDLMTLIERLKSLEPAARPAAQDVADRLQWISEKPARKRRRALIVVAMIGLAFIASVMAVQAFRISQEVRRAEIATQRAAEEAQRASEEAQRANREAESAGRVADFLEGLFSASNPNESLGAAISARDILDHGAAKIRDELGSEPQVQMRLMVAMGRAYQGLGLLDQAGPLFREALEIGRENLPSDDAALIDPLLALANLERFVGLLDLSDQYYTQALDLCRKHQEEEPRRLAETLSQFGILLWYQGRSQEALPILDESEQVFQTMDEVDPLAYSYNLHTLAFVHYELGELKTAENHFRRNLKYRRENLETDHPSIAWALHGLAETRRSRFDQVEARRFLEEALDLRIRVLGPNHQLVGWLENAFGHLELGEGAIDKADGHFLRAVELVRDLPNRALADLGRAEVAMRRGEYEASEKLLSASREMWIGAMGTRHSQIGKFHRLFGDLYRLTGRNEEAEAEYRRAIAFFDNPQHYVLEQVYRGLAEVLSDDPEAAADSLRRAEEIRRAILE